MLAIVRLEGLRVLMLLIGTLKEQSKISRFLMIRVLQLIWGKVPGTDPEEHTLWLSIHKLLGQEGRQVLLLVRSTKVAPHGLEQTMVLGCT